MRPFVARRGYLKPMDKNAIWKWLLTLVLVAGSLVLVTPPSKKIRLGLDLKGGTSFTVAIDEQRIRDDLKAAGQYTTDEAIDKQVQKVLDGASDRALEVLRNRVDNLGIAEPIIYKAKDNRIVIQLPGVDEKKRKEAEESIKSVAFLEFRMVHERNETLVGDLFTKDLAPPGYVPAGGNARYCYRPDADAAVPADPVAAKAALARFHAPPGFEFMLQKDDVDGETVYRPHFVRKRRELSGERLKDAAVDYRTLGQPVVSINFDAEGAKIFSDVTSAYAPGGIKNPDPNGSRQLAIVLDGTLYSAPAIREAIHGGRAEISGSFTLAEAQHLSNVLRSGALPAPVEIVEKRFVAPSLGTDSIRSGVRAALLGACGVLVFMAGYYMLCGLVADIAMLMNLVLLPLGMVIAAGFMGVFVRESSGSAGQLPVLTLPGIAGLILSIGMAVDANVLIFERMREESGTGKRLWSAVQAGFDRAFITIFDSNITTLLTAVILFIFGSGPVRGFAVTLSAGIIVSMYTALVVSKLVFGLFARHSQAKEFRMLQIVKQPHFDFLRHWKGATALSAAIIVVSWAYLGYWANTKPGRIFGVDFTGGSSVTFTFEEGRRVPVDQVRKVLDAAQLKEAHIQYQKEVEKGEDKYLHVKTGGDPVAGEHPISVVRGALTNGFPEANFSVVSEDEVGAQVGSELKSRAAWSIILALIGIIVYISWRFEFGFALGAIAALAHDVLVTAGVFVLCGRQMSLTTVAALLTIVGYSVNDTIVLFDRIRENVKLKKQGTFTEICNLSVNQTLSRTVLTTLTTLITVVMLLVFGGGAINDFALALFIGLIAGTYSTIYIATPVALLWHRGKTPEFSSK